MGKGSKPRPRSTSREEADLRDAYMNGRIGYPTYKKRFAKLKREGLIKRSGIVLR